MLGVDDPGLATETAVLGVDVPANDVRQDYLRARLERDADGAPRAFPFGKQDSALMARLADADCLVIRPPFAPPAKQGETVSILRLDGLGPIAY